MSLITTLEVFKLAFTLAILSYASWSDWKTREVTNYAWVIFAPVGLALTFLEIHLSGNIVLLYSLAISTIVISGLSIPAFYLGFFGGADVKAFLCLALTFPWPLKTFQPLLAFNQVFPFSFSIFTNSLILSLLLIPAILFKNFLFKIRGGSLFDGFEEEKVYKKFFALFLGFKVKKEMVTTRPYMFTVLEEKQTAEDGKTRRKLNLSIKPIYWKNTNNVKELPDDVWVTPTIPMIVFIEAGIITSIFLGDIISWIFTMILR
ncbi:MAG: prepilin peptidase [Candidatus Bathyarchaeota archaeon]